MKRDLLDDIESGKVPLEREEDLDDSEEEDEDEFVEDDDPRDEEEFDDEAEPDPIEEIELEIEDEINAPSFEEVLDLPEDDNEDNEDWEE
jgi:hypothetical protein